MISKKQVLIVVVSFAGAAILAGGGYATGKVFANKKKAGNFVQLEDGRRMKLDNQNFMANEDRPDMMGKIKSVSGESIVIEKFAMPSNVSGEARPSLDGAPKRDGQTSPDGSRPVDGAGGGRKLQIEGEETIIMATDVEILKNARSLNGGPMRDQSANSEPEKISAEDLKQGDMVSVWLVEGTENKTAQKIMVRGAKRE